MLALWAACLTIGQAVAATEPDPQGADFYILNATDVPITSVQASRTDDTNWGANRLTAATLDPGARFLVQLPDDGKCRYDVRVLFRGGNEHVDRDMDVCKLDQLRVVSTGTPPSVPQLATPAPVPATLHLTVVNAFRRDLTELRISPSSSTEWGNNRLGRDPIPSNGQHALDLTTGGTCQFDLQARFDKAGPQEITKVDLCANQTVTFNGPRPGTPNGTGTGFRISASGHIMTANHVVQGCGSMAMLAKDRRLPLRVIGQDPVADLAVLQQTDVITAFLSFRDLSAQLRLAERAISIGFPVPSLLGEGDQVVTDGIINALTGARGDNTQFQLQTPLQPGNSGGPIFDRFGLVIGVTVSGFDSSGERIMQNINFAVKSSVAARFAESLGVQLRYEQGGQDLSTADIMDRDGNRVVQLLCLN